MNYKKMIDELDIDIKNISNVLIKYKKQLSKKYTRRGITVSADVYDMLYLIYQYENILLELKCRKRSLIERVVENG
ncbi:MAG: hypothetical protein IJ371_01305 [Clostridia bacterium]|nr:hypothetical protein [Clostridia bacterium]